MVTIKIREANKKNYGTKRKLSDIKFIVVHYTGNDGDTDEANAKYFQEHIVNASAHYFVDDDSITQSVPDDYVAWSVGGKKYPSTKGGTFHGKCTNSNSISVELCDCKKNGKYDFTEATVKNAVDIVKLLMKKYSVPIDNVIRHYDVTGKRCPEPFIANKKEWLKFKESVADEMIEKSTIIVDGKEITVKRILKDNTNFIAIRDLSEALGYKIGNKGNIPILSKS